MKVTVLILFAISIGVIFLYSLIQLSLIFSYLKAKRQRIKPPDNCQPEDLPLVTVQLPLYNELYVVERLIDCVCAFDYPHDKLEIQILDDSDDESFEIAANKIREYNLKGIDIKHVIRPNRVGYKAGALAYGTAICKGDFIAIFDADFLPEQDFLKRALPHFTRKEIGVVQCKWGYINPDYSILTMAQAFGLNAHFSIEQVGRNARNYFINFNGTAGIWRKKCIIDAGGWQSDTLTEDLDLSYRAQLKGWKFQYVEEIEAPSELPIEINALKAQQYRWTKGAAECSRKNLPKVMRAKNISISTKIHAFFHLMNSSVFLFILLISLLSLPVIIVKPILIEYTYLYQLSSFLMLGWFILAAFYWVSHAHDTEKKGKLLISFLYRFPLFLSISMGLALHNSMAVIEGWLGIKTPFIRTPKFNLNRTNKRWESNRYNMKKLGFFTYLEAFLLVYFLFTLKVAFAYGDFGIMPIIIFLITGYGIVFLSSVVHWNKTIKALTYE